jgi:uncharacterized protein YbcV (DUF1398 family)
MFTLDQIKTAHSKVKSGADFPNYIQELKKLGISNYETFVSDGHTDFYGTNNYKISTPSRYEILTISDKSNATQFSKELKEHQQGKSDYPYFCAMSARTGVEKWAVDMSKMTCTYFDKAGSEVLKEIIPQ